MAAYLPNQLFQVPLAELQPDPTQPRKYMDPVALDEMTASVGQVGIIQPIVCRQDQLAQIIGKSPTTISEALSLNRLPQEIRDECRQDPAVPKNVLVEIARKKQERGILTKFRQYREKQAKAAAKDNGTPAERKRTKAEALAEGIGLTASKIDEIDFPSFSTEDRTMLIESMTAMKDILEAAITRAVENKKKPT